MPLHGLGWLGDGRDVYIENQENRSADRNALGERMEGETTWTTRDNSFKVRRPNRAATGSAGVPPAENAGGKREGCLTRRRGDAEGGNKRGLSDFRPALFAESEDSVTGNADFFGKHEDRGMAGGLNRLVSQYRFPQNSKGRFA